jgi:hypothetical protein
VGPEHLRKRSWRGSKNFERWGRNDFAESDFGRHANLVPGELARRVHDRYPHLDMARCLTDAIIGQAQGRPQKAPPYTLPGELVRERAAGSSGTGMERLAAHGRWRS